MPDTMKAARFYRGGEPFRIEEIPIPDVDRGEILIRVLRAGSNGGDVHLRRGVYDAYLRLRPFVIGHEGMGEVVEVGPQVHGLEVGDLVISRPTLTCGFCKFCRTEREHLCVHHRVMGFVSFATKEDIFARYKDGLWAEYCRIPATNVQKLRKGDDVDAFSLVSVIAVGYRALKRARFGEGETVIINGATGVTGIPTVLAALALGAAQIIGVAQNAERLARLREIDPRRISIISTKTESIRERILELTEGTGAGVLVDLVPDDNDTTLDCLRALEQGGRAALLAAKREPLRIDHHLFLVRGIEITSSTGRHYADIAELIELTRRGVIDVSPIRPTFFKLEEANEAIDAVDRRKTPHPVWPMMRAD